MTKERALFLLYRYKVRIPVYNLPRIMPRCQKQEVMVFHSVCAQTLVSQLIKDISADSLADPIEVVRKTYYLYDDILSTSEQPVTWEFASTMESIASDILEYLRMEEKTL